MSGPRVLIRKALENYAKNMTSALAADQTAGENAPFKPANGTPYQRWNLMFAEPDNSIASASVYFERGIFQVTLCYPKDTGPNGADAMSDLVRARFKRGTTVVCDDGTQVQILRTPSVGQPIPNDTVYAVPVSVRFQAQINS